MAAFKDEASHRFAPGESLPVRPLTGEGVKGIDYLEYSGGQRNLLSPQSIRVPGSIPSLVMVADYRQDAA